jgi:(p)ppGpp synthase/HD superfamily hydrolase
MPDSNLSSNVNGLSIQCESMPKLFDAIEFATRAHEGQFRKGTRIPFIIHPLSVAKLLIEREFSEEVVIAGLLHDTLEDARTARG